ncbi:2OG-Fe(II) oxygenase [Panacibacter sp. DH6]|uniref:2OG-Fe(II) oxygenase n=1 Tax=Panacibacter microcysteis TaxID=2793269 RepID=A0A931GVD4_9BACT|nr:2OG-Fe(II) oxygenase [Panacibacter microcysteis]MBG9377696.1 2OG-Fe(II) oxygenase [Panacibacter microcysteis]
MQLNKLTDTIFTIDDFWTRQECEDFISKSEAIGYEPATVDTEKGQKIVEAVRNNYRVIYTDIVLADNIWRKLKPFAPSQIGNSKAVGLNELFRFYKYQAGQEFKKHRDQSFIRDEVEASYFTFMIYLNNDYEGGETTFNSLTIQPIQGSALIFLHDLEHEGSSVRRGIKYVLRTDIMFRLTD